MGGRSVYWCHSVTRPLCVCKYLLKTRWQPTTNSSFIDTIIAIIWSNGSNHLPKCANLILSSFFACSLQLHFCIWNSHSSAVRGQIKSTQYYYNETCNVRATSRRLIIELVDLVHRPLHLNLNKIAKGVKLEIEMEIEIIMSAAVTWLDYRL